LAKAKALYEEDSDWTWTGLSPEQRVDLKEEINIGLAEKQIPEVSEDVVQWRMAHCFQSLKSNASTWLN
jgi:hypothetical protein